METLAENGCRSRRAFLRTVGGGGLLAAGLPTGVFDLAFAASPGNAGSLRPDSCSLRDAPWLADRINKEFERYRPGWSPIRSRRLAQLDTLLATLLERQQHGFSCPIADQIYVEARWLASSTTDDVRIGERIAAFEKAIRLQREIYDPPALQQAEDGSWAPYVDEPFHKLDISIDYIHRIVGAANPVLTRCDGGNRLPALTRPLVFLRHWADPAAMIDELRDCQSSQIHRTGVWNRQKYASLLSSLAQLMLKSRIETWLREEANDTTFTARHKAMFVDFLDEMQDPCTGCWRDGYRFYDGSTHQAYDLSNLYHVVQYRHTGIRRWNEIADGLLAVREFQYPQGPLGPGRQADDHNDYDVFRIARRCLDDADPSLTAERRAQLQSYIRNIAIGAVRRIAGNFPASGSQDFVSSVEADCYRVRLLDDIGYWTGRSPFLGSAEMGERRRLADIMLQRLIAYSDPSPMPVLAIATLRDRLGLC